MDKDLNLDQKTPMYAKHARYLALAAAVSFSSGATAQLLHNVTIGNPKALALGNAVTADPPGIDSIHFNPAGLAKIKGRQMNLKVLAAHMTIDGDIGEPTRPTNTIKEVYYQGNNGNPNKPQCSGGAVPTQEELDNCWGIDPIANTSTSIDGPGLMLPFVGFTEVPILAFPAGGIAFEDPARGWTFGTAVYSPQGIGYTRKDGDPKDGIGDPGAYQGVNVGVTRLTYFSPTVAIPVSDRLSFGVGINFSYQGMALDTYIRAPLETTQFLDSVNELPLPDDLNIIKPYDTVGRLSMEMEDFLSVGFNFGILYEPYDWLSFGFLYQSETTSQLSGDYKMENTEEFMLTTEGLAPLGGTLGAFGGAAFNATEVEKGTVELEYLMPQNIAFGTSIKVLPNLKINFDVRWVEYSVWDELKFEFSNNVDFLNLSSVIYTVAGGFDVKDNADPDEMRIRRAYEDTWSVAIGAEYQWNDNLVLRAGYEPREGAIPSSSADLLFPIGDADLFTAGFGWQMSNTTRIDAAFGILYSEQSIDACESKNANTCQEGDVVYNPYYSMPFETETTAYIAAISFDKKF